MSHTPRSDQTVLRPDLFLLWSCPNNVGIGKARKMLRRFSALILHPVVFWSRFMAQDSCPAEDPQHPQVDRRLETRRIYIRCASIQKCLTALVSKNRTQQRTARTIRVLALVCFICSLLLLLFVIYIRSYKVQYIGTQIPSPTRTH